MSRLRSHLLFAAAILVTGVLSGLVGASITVLVRAVQHLTYLYTQGPLLLGVIAASPERRLLGPAIGCAVAGLGWWLLRRKAAVPGLNPAIRADRPFAAVPMSLDAVLQVLAVGSGASLGREQAPRMLAAVGTDLLIRAGTIAPAQRRLLLGGAAGAGLAAVYNVPTAGALFTLGIVLHTWRPTAALVAVATSSIATVTAWPVSHGAPTFGWPPTDVTVESVLIALAVMPVAALIGTGFTTLITHARPPTPRASWTMVPALGLAGLVTGAASLWLPQLPGNGKSIVAESLSGAAQTLPQRSPHSRGATIGHHAHLPGLAAPPDGCSARFSAVWSVCPGQHLVLVRRPAIDEAVQPGDVLPPDAVRDPSAELLRRATNPGRNHADVDPARDGALPGRAALTEHPNRGGRHAPTDPGRSATIGAARGRYRPHSGRSPRCWCGA